MKERILQVRKDSKLTQDAFASRLNLSKNFVWMLEKGERIPSDRTILDICREFNINEGWLRTGKGEMYKLPEDKLSHVLGQIAGGDDVFIQDLVLAYMDLDDVSKAALRELRDNMLARQKEREQK